VFVRKKEIEIERGGKACMFVRERNKLQTRRIEINKRESVRECERECVRERARPITSSTSAAVLPPMLSRLSSWNLNSGSADLNCTPCFNPWKPTGRSFRCHLRDIMHSETVIMHTETVIMHTETVIMHTETVIMYTETVIMHTESVIMHTETTIMHSETVIMLTETVIMHT
jgi:hypothetical protein